MRAVWHCHARRGLKREPFSPATAVPSSDASRLAPPRPWLSQIRAVSARLARGGLRREPFSPATVVSVSETRLGASCMMMPGCCGTSRRMRTMSGAGVNVPWRRPGSFWNSNGLNVVPSPPDRLGAQRSPRDRRLLVHSWRAGTRRAACPQPHRDSGDGAVIARECSKRMPSAPVDPAGHAGNPGLQRQLQDIYRIDMAENVVHILCFWYSRRDELDLGEG